ncbi:MAG: hypothetical protein M3176_09300 [Chloroflexota bacterium]|nr:hypothetical protein [Chloroflexota bacterium]
MQKTHMFVCSHLVRPVLIGLLIVALTLAIAPPPPVTAAPPPTIPPGRDTTVPLEPPATIQRGNETVQTMPLRRMTTADGREAVADRIIVGFKNDVSDVEQARCIGPWLLRQERLLPPPLSAWATRQRI